MQRSDRVDLGKTTVVCKTCGITESFYSDLSVEAFKLRHKGHQVEGGRPAETRARPRPSPAPVEQAPALEDETGRKVSRVLVDLVHFPALPEPAFRVRGYIDGVDEAFVLTSPASQAAKIRQLLQGGRYLAEEPERALFTWEAYAVDYEDGVGEKLEVDATAVAEPPAERPAVVAEELTLDAPAEAAAAPARMAEVVEKQPEPEPEEEYLLVSKSWYIQGGTQNRREAVRISKALKEFRWRVEPMYTLGVMLDDIVSIESARNEIGRELIQAMEATGYKLTVVTAEQSKVVAWFKKGVPEITTTEEAPARAPAPETQAKAEEGPTAGDAVGEALVIEAQQAQ